jgi:general secretion pathway protein A
MYTTFFGFREKPFKLVPNPEYLFLSKGHEVALAHLNYATKQGDGFVVITGEVGTGKTTLCRNYLEQLDEQTDSAYIFNPCLEGVQLLTSICHEFGIQTNDTPTIKTLLDQLNHYLIAQNLAGRQVVLLIDEAQALSIENLELVRMISNLETTRSKLLQIILVGQPELGHQLDAYELRQLAQRISLNCYLDPLSEKETVAYIQHRVNIAAQRHIEIFSTDACRQIHRYAGGIPRLINIACDRVLLSAYSQNLPKVTRSMVKKVEGELSSHGRGDQRRRLKPVYLWLPLAVIMLVLAGFGIQHNGRVKRFLVPTYSQEDAKVPDLASAKDAPMSTQTGSVVRSYKIPAFNPTPDPASPAPDVAPQPSAATAPVVTPGLSETLQSLAPATSRMDALTILLACWGQPRPNPAVIPATIDEHRFFKIAARQYGLRAFEMEVDWPMIKRLNLPAIVVFKHPQTQQGVYLTLTGWQHDRLVLSDREHERTIETDLEAIQSQLQGTVYIFWKNIIGFDFIISHGASTKSISMVKSLLRQVGYDRLSPSLEFDQQTRLAIMDFQKRHKIKVDGLVGPLTKIFLIQKANAFDFPLLDPDRGAGA